MRPWHPFGISIPYGAFCIHPSDIDTIYAENRYKTGVSWALPQLKVTSSFSSQCESSMPLLSWVPFRAPLHRPSRLAFLSQVQSYTQECLSSYSFNSLWVHTRLLNHFSRHRFIPFFRFRLPLVLCRLFPPWLEFKDVVRHLVPTLQTTESSARFCTLETSPPYDMSPSCLLTRISHSPSMIPRMEKQQSMWLIYSLSVWVYTSILPVSYNNE